MAELERTVLDFYQISNPYPVEWPADKGGSDGSDDEEDRERKAKIIRRKSRYQVLERAATNRSSKMILGSEKGNLVQRDEPDPLGTTDSIVTTLKRLGVPAQDDPKLREFPAMVNTHTISSL